MNLTDRDLTALFPAEEGRRVAIIGAGGKSTTMVRLAEQHRSEGRPVAVTTTTRIQAGQARGPIHESVDASLIDSPPRVFTLARPESPNEVRRAGPEAGAKPAGAKLNSPPERELKRLLEQYRGRVLVEADGARRRKLKVHRSFEPVIPEPLDAVLIVLNLDVLNRRPGDNLIHKMDRWQRLFPDVSTLRHEHLERLLREDEGYRVDVPVWLQLVRSPGGREKLPELLEGFSRPFFEQFERIGVMCGDETYGIDDS